MKGIQGGYLAFSDFLFSPPIRTPGTIQVKGCRKKKATFITLLTYKVLTGILAAGFRTLNSRTAAVESAACPGTGE